MSMSDAIRHYRATQVTTATPPQLVLIVLDAVISRLQAALGGLSEARVDQASNAILRAQALIGELRLALRREAGPVADNLDALYEFMQQRLVQANLRKDPALVSEVQGMVRELRRAWQEAMGTGPAHLPAAESEVVVAIPRRK